MSTWYPVQLLTVKTFQLSPKEHKGDRLNRGRGVTGRENSIYIKVRRKKSGRFKELKNTRWDWCVKYEGRGCSRCHYEGKQG